MRKSVVRGRLHWGIALLVVAILGIFATVIFSTPLEERNASRVKESATQAGAILDGALLDSSKCYVGLRVDEGAFSTVADSRSAQWEVLSTSFIFNSGPLYVAFKKKSCK